MNNIEQNITKLKLPIFEIHTVELVTEDTSNAKCYHEDEIWKLFCHTYKRKYILGFIYL